TGPIALRMSPMFQLLMIAPSSSLWSDGFCSGCRPPALGGDPVRTGPAIVRNLSSSPRPDGFVARVPRVKKSPPRRRGDRRTAASRFLGCCARSLVATRVATCLGLARDGPRGLSSDDGYHEPRVHRAQRAGGSPCRQTAALRPMDVAEGHLQRELVPVPALRGRSCRARGAGRGLHLA